MKKLALSSLLFVLLIQSCRPTSEKSGNPRNRTAAPLYSLPIPIDTANRMIQSYLTSVSYPPNNTCLRSLIFNADTLRSYINDTTKGKIANVKLMFAHPLSWINSGHYGVKGGTKAAALTLILVGLDVNGRFVYNASNEVYENMQPCPNHCPENNSDLLTR